MDEDSKTPQIVSIETFMIAHMIASWIIRRILEAYGVPEAERTPEKIDVLLREHPPLFDSVLKGVMNGRDET